MTRTQVVREWMVFVGTRRETIQFIRRREVVQNKEPYRIEMFFLQPLWLTRLNFSVQILQKKASYHRRITEH